MLRKTFSKSRRTFLKRISAFLALPAFLGIQHKAKAEPESGAKYPLPECAECKARFCRYKV